MLRSEDIINGMINSIIDPFADALIGWDKDFYQFYRKEKDMYPYTAIAEKDKLVIVHNVLGINKEDISISIKRENETTYLLITGNSKDEITNQSYRIRSRFPLKEGKYELDKIEATAKNGLVYITIPYKKEIIEAKQDRKITIK